MLCRTLREKYSATSFKNNTMIGWTGRFILNGQTKYYDMFSVQTEDAADKEFGLYLTDLINSGQSEMYYDDDDYYDGDFDDLFYE